MDNRVAETIIILITAGCVVELMAIAIVVGIRAGRSDERRVFVATFCRREIIALSFGFFFLLFGDVNFYLGNTTFIGWPWPPLLFRSLCLVIFGRCLARLSGGRR